MNRTDTYLALTCAAVFFAIVAGVSGKARSQEHHPGHAAFHDVYKEWMMPTRPEMPCCNAKYDTQGNLRAGGDCYATIAESRPSAEHPDGPIVWWALRDNGEWVEIGKRYILNELNPDSTGTRAHLCENFHLGGGVLCFLPPVGGS
jgi:hypothetical protein